MALKFTVILLPEEEGGYSIICPALPGCVSQGDSLQEALANIKEAAELWLEVWLENGNPIQQETPELVAEEIRQCLIDRAEDGLPLLVETRQIELTSPVTV